MSKRVGLAQVVLAAIGDIFLYAVILSAIFLLVWPLQGCAAQNHHQAPPPGYKKVHYEHCVEVSVDAKTGHVMLDCAPINGKADHR